jgi:hypothetical protein
MPARCNHHSGAPAASRLSADRDTHRCPKRPHPNRRRGPAAGAAEAAAGRPEGPAAVDLVAAGPVVAADLAVADLAVADPLRRNLDRAQAAEDPDLPDRGLAARGLAGPGQRVRNRNLVDRADLADLVGRVKGRATDLAAPVDLAKNLVARVDRAKDLVAPVDRAKDLVARAAPVRPAPGRDPADGAKARDKRLDRDPVVRLDRDPVALPGRVVRRRDRPHRSPRKGPTTGVTTSSADRAMHLADSARPATAHHPRRGTEASAGMTDRHPADRRRTGTGRHLPVAGTVLPLPVAGTTGTTDRPATSA